MSRCTRIGAAAAGLVALACCPACKRPTASPDTPTSADLPAADRARGGADAVPDVERPPGNLDATAATLQDAPDAADEGPAFPLDRLPTPEPAWTRPLGEWSPERIDTPDGPAVVAIDPDGSLVLLDARDGRVRWTRRPPEGETWYGITTGPGPDPVLAVNGGNADEQMVLHRIRPADGSSVWQRTVDDSGSPEVSDWGDGLELESYSACAARAMDVDNGDLLGPALRGTDMEIWDRDFHPAGHRCGLAAVRVLVAHAGVAVASYPDGRGLRLSAFGPGEAPLWSRSWPAASLRNVGRDGAEGVFACLDPSTANRPQTVFRIDLATGREIWSRTFDTAESCADERSTGPLRFVPGPGESTTAVLIPDCRRTRALDARTGATLWERDCDGYSLVVGERSEEQLPFGYGPLTIRWLAPDGQPGALLTLPAGIRSFQVVPSGLLVSTNEQDRVALLDGDGATRWEIGIRIGNFFAIDDGVAVLTDGTQVLIEPTTGEAWGIATDSPWVLTRLPGDDGGAPLWVVVRDEPHELVAVRTPPGRGASLRTSAGTAAAGD